MNATAVACIAGPILIVLWLAWIIICDFRRQRATWNIHAIERRDARAFTKLPPHAVRRTMLTNILTRISRPKGSGRASTP